jgi:transcriptional regulator GlxA family with amidase domain
MKSAINLFLPNLKPLDTVVLVLDQSNTLSFAAATDPMRAANRKSGKPLFNWRFATAEGVPARLTTGLEVSGPAIAKIAQCDLLIVVAGFDLARHATAQLSASLRRFTEQGAGVIAIDGGPWLLANAGLLNGHPATTHWEDLDDFASRFPEVETRRDRYCLSPPFATSGGASPAIDLMLHLIANRWGSDLAQRTAGAFLYDPVPEGRWQTPSSLPRDPRRPLAVTQALDLMAESLSDPRPIHEIAKAVAQSPRRLEQLFAQHVGQPPQRYYLHLRLTQAHRLATDTPMSVRDIGFATGFGSLASFSRAFKAQFGLSVSALRGGSYNEHQRP